MDHARKHVKVGAVKIFDTNLIYSKVIGLQACEREIDIKHCFLFKFKKSQINTDRGIRVSRL